MLIIIIIIIIIIIVKTSNTGQRRKNIFFLEVAFATTQAPVPRKTEENATQGSNHRLTAPLNPSSALVSNSVVKVIPHSNLGRQETPFKLGRSTP